MKKYLNIRVIKQSNNMGLNNHTLKVFENNRNVDPQSHGCQYFRISVSVHTCMYTLTTPTLQMSNIVVYLGLFQFFLQEKMSNATLRVFSTALYHELVSILLASACTVQLAVLQNQHNLIFGRID